MAETKELYADIDYIKNKVDSLEKINLIAMRANHPLRQYYIDAFTATPGLYDVYKCIDGKVAQNEIMAITVFSQPKVSKLMTRLKEIGLIEFKCLNEGKKIYRHTVVEKAFQFRKGYKCAQTKEAEQ